MNRHVTITIVFLLIISFFVSVNVQAIAFPTIESSSGGRNTDTGAISTTVNLPTGGGGISSGDLLIIAIGSGSGIISTPTGWTLTATTTAFPGSIQGDILSKISIGGETTQVISVAGATVWQSVRIVGQFSLPSGNGVGAGSQDCTTPPNSLNFDPTLGVRKFLWLSVGMYREAISTAAIWNITGAPTSFFSVRGTDGIFPTPPAVDVGIRTAYRHFEASSLNPGAFPFTPLSCPGESMDYSAFTVAINPTNDNPIITLPATVILPTSAKLNGNLVGPLFSDTITVRFQYGLTESLGTNSVDETVSGTGLFDITVTGLEQNTQYFFRAFFEEVPSGYSDVGATLNFTTTFSPVTAIRIGAYFYLLIFFVFMLFLLLVGWEIKKRRN